MKKREKKKNAHGRVENEEEKRRVVDSEMR
jgi:hypothetical protein